MSKLKISIAVATLIGLAYFNRGLDRGRSSEQRAYDAWVTTINSTANEDRAKSVVISAKIPAAHGTDSFQISGTDSAERVQRLAELISVSNIFSLPARDPATPGSVQIEVVDSEVKFTAVATPEFVSSSVPTQSFLKLLTIYAGDPPHNENKK